MRSQIVGKVRHFSARRVTEIASVLALLGLIIFALPLFYPKPLIVIFSMSVGHGVGAAAFLLYLLAVVIDSLGPPRDGKGSARPPTE